MILFENKTNCCGCGACAAVCPKRAIVMSEDEYGFRYPKIDNDLCVDCGACKRVCPLGDNVAKSEPIDAYAATNKNVEQLLKSASGGIFSAIAQKLIEEGWIIWGAVYDFDTTGFVKVCHEKATDSETLKKQFGSKYVQSNTDAVFSEIKNELRSGNKVLFSGTPCQVAAVKSFVGNQGENLLTIDVICHGVPSVKMLKEYFNVIGNKNGGVVTDFVFRDKNRGWGMTACAKITNANGKSKTIVIPSNNSSYFNLFLKSATYRDSCYECHFAEKGRVGDLTIGDYWGIKSAHPDLTNNEAFAEEKGISCILVNSIKGQDIINNCVGSLNLVKSDFERIAKENHQLTNPSEMSNDRVSALNEYKNNGFVNLEQLNKNQVGNKYYLNYIKAIMPTKLKTYVKRLMKK